MSEPLHITRLEALTIAQKLQKGLWFSPTEGSQWTERQLFMVAAAAVAAISWSSDDGPYSKIPAMTPEHEKLIERRIATTIHDLAKAISLAVQGNWEKQIPGETYYPPSPIENEN